MMKGCIEQRSNEHHSNLNFDWIKICGTLIFFFELIKGITKCNYTLP